MAGGQTTNKLAMKMLVARVRERKKETTRVKGASRLPPPSTTLHHIGPGMKVGTFA